MTGTKGQSAEITSDTIQLEKQLPDRPQAVMFIGVIKYISEFTLLNAHLAVVRLLPL